MQQITFGKRYPLSSFTQSTCDSATVTDGAESLTTLQYVFKPSSIDPDNAGSLSISDSGEVIVDLPTLEGKTQTERFKGISTKPSNEFILSFDGSSFKVEKVVSAVTNIRHCRNETKFSTKETTISAAQKIRTQKLLTRAGSRVSKHKVIAKPGGTKISTKRVTSVVDVDAVPEHGSVLTGTESISSTASKDASRI